MMICILLFSFIQNSNAQKKQKPFHFKSIHNIGEIIGEKESCFSLQTINGLQLKNNWFFGLGVAYDPYQIAAIPAFVDVRKYFGHQQWQPFLYADAGESFALHNSTYPKTWYGGSQAYTFKPSLYGEAGLGFSKSIAKNAKFILSAGYSYKQFNYSQPNYIIIDFPPYGTGSISEYQYRFNFQRLSIKMGLEF